MYWWITFAILLVLGTVMAIVEHKTYDVWPIPIIVISFVAAFFIGLISICYSIKLPQEVYQFKVQKQYIETHVAKDSMENAALTTEKVRQNEWLYGAQYSVTVWHGWSFYPNSVKDLKPIQ